MTNLSSLQNYQIWDKIYPLPVRVLVAEKDVRFFEQLSHNLQQTGYECWWARTGIDALHMLRQHTFDIVLLEMKLAKMGGFEVCSKLRKYSTMPVIMLSATACESDMLKGLEVGADQWMKKPFEFLELNARIRALMRRTKRLVTNETSHPVVVHGDFMILKSKGQVLLRNKPLDLTYYEYHLLCYLVDHANQIICKEELVNAIWHYDTSEDTGFLRVMICRLREKIEEDPSHPRYLTTVLGQGYRLCTNPNIDVVQTSLLTH